MLPRSDVDGDARPPPGVDPEPNGHEGLGGRLRSHPLLPSVADVLAPNHVGGRQRSHRLEQHGARVTYGIARSTRGWLHAEVGHDGQQVVLQDVPDGAHRVIEGTPVGHPEALGHRDLNRPDVAALPYGLEDRVGEAGVDDVLDRILAQVVVDPIDPIFAEAAVQELVELLGGLGISAEWLLHHDAGADVAADRGQAIDHDGEQAGRDRQIVDGEFRVGELGLERLIGGGIRVVTRDIAKEPRQLGEVGLVEGAVLLDALAGARLQVGHGPIRAGHADDGCVQLAGGHQSLERWEDLLERQITGGAIEDEGICDLRSHRQPPMTGPSRGALRIRSAWPRGSCRRTGLRLGRRNGWRAPQTRRGPAHPHR